MLSGIKSFTGLKELALFSNTTVEIPKEYFLGFSKLVNLDSLALLLSAEDANNFSKAGVLPPNLNILDFGIKVNQPNDAKELDGFIENENIFKAISDLKSLNDARYLVFIVENIAFSEHGYFARLAKDLFSKFIKATTD